MEVKVLYLKGNPESDEQVLGALAAEGWEMRGLMAYMGLPTAYLYRVKAFETAPQKEHKKEEVPHGKDRKENRR